ncbi:MAG TPA: metal ABC transporter ATP-binding protein, partial [Candidatus Ozemobacteraceae bacterium]|nr:metal ABC transporter ATP-binding protein [Candidatus Ozemobacteraceae bacterium]
MVHPLLTLENVGVRRGGEEVLTDVNCQIHRGMVTAIIGPNGAGKTTLLQAILGLLPSTGRMRYFDGQGVERSGRPKIGYVPQRLGFDRALPITVLEFLALMLQRRPIWISIKERTRERAQEALQKLHASHLLTRPLEGLSGGEMQRVLLAAALMDEPELLLLDEPVSAVDIAGGHLFCDVLEEAREKHRLTVVMVSHDLSVVSQHAQKVICLNRTVSCQGDAPEVLSAEQLFAIYGVHSALYQHRPSHTQTACESCHECPQCPRSSGESGNARCDHEH